MTNETKPGHTKLWHSLVERAVVNAQRRGKPFTIADVLDSVGVFTWAPHRAQAEAYAAQLVGVKGTLDPPPA
jgi:hypothetical protein